MMFLVGFITGGILCFFLGLFIALKANAEGMAKMLKRGDIFIKQNGKWSPYDPFKKG